MPLLRKMRSSPLVFLLIVIVLSVACTEGGLAEPIPLPRPLPTVTPAPVATSLPPATNVPPITALPTPTEEPAATELPSATPLPTPAPAPVAAVIPVATHPPAATELPTAEPAPLAPVLPESGPTADSDAPLVTIGNATWPVELAITPAERSQGLSGREELPEGTGMLFVFEGDQHLTFWMPEMNFPLDMVWIDSGCRVVDATLNAPAPESGQSLGDLPRFSPKMPARFVLEINAGEFEGRGTSVGEEVRFEGALEGQHGC